MFCFCHRLYLEKLAQGRVSMLTGWCRKLGSPQCRREGQRLSSPGLVAEWVGLVTSFPRQCHRLGEHLGSGPTCYVSLGTVLICVPPFSL